MAKKCVQSPSIGGLWDGTVLTVSDMDLFIYLAHANMEKSFMRERKSEGLAINLFSATSHCLKCGSDGDMSVYLISYDIIFSRLIWLSSQISKGEKKTCLSTIT